MITKARKTKPRKWPKATWSALNGRVRLYRGDAAQIMQLFPRRSVAAVICDPPYPEIHRNYGCLSELEWQVMMDKVLGQSRSILNRKGSAVFILQPNRRHMGMMRSWLWEFLAKWSAAWNQVQDVWWWNFTTIPQVKSTHLRPSIKLCAWFGPPDCHTCIAAVRWKESEANRAQRESMRCTNKLERFPSGHSMRRKKCHEAALRNGGVTPYNLLPIPGRHRTPGESNFHGAQTPRLLMAWWILYLTRQNQIVLDPFMGSGTTGLAALAEGRRFMGIEKDAGSFRIARERIKAYLADR